MAHSYFYMTRENQKKGPVPEQMLRQLVSMGLISSDTQIWCDSEIGWKPLSAFPEFGDSVANLPLPPPPTFSASSATGTQAPPSAAPTARTVPPQVVNHALKNVEAIRIRAYGRNVLVWSIVLGIFELLYALFEPTASTSTGWSIIGFGFIIYSFCRGFSEIIELLHHIAIGLGVVDPESNRKRSVLAGNSIIDQLFLNHQSHR